MTSPNIYLILSALWFIGLLTALILLVRLIRSMEFPSSVAVPCLVSTITIAAFFFAYTFVPFDISPLTICRRRMGWFDTGLGWHPQKIPTSCDNVIMIGREQLFPLGMGPSTIGLPVIVFILSVVVVYVFKKKLREKGG